MQEEQNAGWSYNPGSTSQYTNDYASSQVNEAATSIGKVEWTASEYIANSKNFMWYMGLAIAILLISAVIYILGRDWVSIMAVVLIGLSVGVFAAQEPKVLKYSVDSTGLNVGNKEYPFSLFKSFSVAQEGAFRSVSLKPLKRFMPPLSIHFDPDDEGKIIDTISLYLPYEEHEEDMVDNLSRRLRF